jgi:hypothetical protein
MLHALPDREDVGVGGFHVVVDDDAARDVETGFEAQLHVGPNAGRHDDEVGLEATVVGQRHALHVAVPQDGGRGAPEQHPHPHVLDLSDQVLAAVGIELAFHQRRSQVHHGHVATLHLQPAGRLQPQEAPADHDRLHARTGAPHHLAGVVQRAERQHAVLVKPFDRRQERGAARGEEQRVVRCNRAIRPRHGLGVGVHVHDAHADAQVDGLPLIPLDWVDDDVVGRLLAGQHRRQHDAVVVDVRLVAEDGHLIARLVLQDLLQARHPGHAVADDYKPLHRTPP